MGCWLGTARLFDLYGLLQALNAVICEAGCFLVAFAKDTLAGCLDIAQVGPVLWPRGRRRQVPLRPRRAA
jgi:hypothetical protein